MTRRAAVTQSEYRRAIRAAEECGYSMCECEFTPEKVRLIFAQAAPLDPPPAPVDAAPDPVDPVLPKEWPRG